MKQKVLSSLALLLLLTAAMPWNSLRAQNNYVEIAPNFLANTSMDGRPQFEQMIYTKAEMGNQSRTLYGIELSRLPSSVSKDTVMLIDIYLGETVKDTFDATNSWVSPKDLARVFTGTFHFRAGHSKDTIVFDQPYDYSGTKNLVFTIFEHTGTYISNFIQFKAHNVANNKGVYLSYLKYGSNTVDMNYADRWTTAYGNKWHCRYNIKFFTSTWYLSNPAMPTAQAPYTASLTGGPNQIELTWKTYGDKGAWWEFGGGDTGAVCHNFSNINGRGCAKLVSPLIEVNSSGTARLTFSLKYDCNSTDSLIVYYSKSDYVDEWVRLKTFSTTNGFEQQTIDIPSCSHFRIAFEGKVFPNEPIYIKNVSVTNVAATSSTSNQPYYAFMQNNGGSGADNNYKFVNFGLANVAATPTSVSSRFYDDLYCAEKVGDYIYYVGGSRDDYGLYRTAFTEGTTIQEGDYLAELDYSNTFAELRHDESDDVLLGLEIAGYTTRLYEIDPSDGEADLLTTLDGCFSAMAVTPTGSIYLLKYGNRAELYKLSSRYSSYPYLVATAPLPACNTSAQSMVFDRRTGKLIWLQEGSSSGDGGVYGIDPATGIWEFYGKLGGTSSTAVGLFTISSVPDADVQSTVYWYGIDHTENYENESVDISLVKFSMQNPSAYNTLCSIPTSNDESAVMAAELINDTLFYILYENNEDGYESNTTQTLYRQPFNGQALQGSPVALGTITNNNEGFVVYRFGLAYNPVDKGLYTCSWFTDWSEFGPSIAICRINRNNDSPLQPINQFYSSDEMPTAIAISSNGTFYVMLQNRETHMMQLCTVDATGFTVIGSTGIYDENRMGQDMYFDPATGELFWTCLNGDGLSIIYKIDLSSGQAAKVGSLDTEENILTCFFLRRSTTSVENPAEVAVCTYPNPVSDRLTVEAADNITMLQLYNLQGSLQRIVGGNLGTTATLDVKDLPAGVYILSTTTAKGTSTQKVVIGR